MKAKDYELIASHLKYAANEGWIDHIELVAEDMADSFEQANPKFDRQKFLTACGVEQTIDRPVLTTRDGGKTYWEGDKQINS